MTRRQADAVCTAFRHLMMNGGAVADGEGLDKLVLFATVRGRPSRIPCVMLAWTDTTERTLRHIIV
jgi:NifU-like protein involved in Fe-S cluster formation